MTKILIVLGLFALAACSAADAPPGQASPGGNTNGVTGSKSTGR